jgi:hypothetical protein
MRRVIWDAVISFGSLRLADIGLLLLSGLRCRCIVQIACIGPVAALSFSFEIPHFLSNAQAHCLPVSRARFASSNEKLRTYGSS